MDSNIQTTELRSAANKRSNDAKYHTASADAKYHTASASQAPEEDEHAGIEKIDPNVDWGQAASKHSWYYMAAEEFMQAEGSTSIDCGADGLKTANLNYANSWYVAAALTMTVGFAMIMADVSELGDDDDQVAVWATRIYLLLSLLGTVNSFLAVYIAGHAVAQAGWKPASHYAKYYSVSNPIKLSGHSCEFAKVALLQLVLALLPLTYLYYGVEGAGITAAVLLYTVLQLVNFRLDMNRMGALQAQAKKHDSNLPFHETYTGCTRYCFTQEGHLGGMQPFEASSYTYTLAGFASGYLLCNFVHAFRNLLKWAFKGKVASSGPMPARVHQPQPVDKNQQPKQQQQFHHQMEQQQFGFMEM